MAETAADMPQPYRTFKNDAQEPSDKAARHRLMADLLPEIWGYASTAAKHGHQIFTAIRDALAGKPWIPPIPAIT
jgi:hypothetical protein